jgi:putative membrane protein insertion efficiency factor
VAGRFALLVIRAYQLGLAAFAGGACRFHPSCSVYATTAIEEHGALKGALLALGRLARCHPLARPGIDPVPPRATRS